MSLRQKDWLVFSALVATHIEEYTVPQYGDKGDDLADDYTPEECVMQMKRYLQRFGRTARQGEQQLDFLKIAHYAQMCHTKLGEENAKSR